MWLVIIENEATNLSAAIVGVFALHFPIPFLLLVIFELVIGVLGTIGEAQSC